MSAFLLFAILISAALAAELAQQYRAGLDAFYKHREHYCEFMSAVEPEFPATQSFEAFQAALSAFFENDTTYAEPTVVRQEAADELKIAMNDGWEFEICLLRVPFREVWFTSTKNGTLQALLNFKIKITL